MTNDLATKKCTACEGGIPPLTREQFTPFLSQIDSDWKVVDDKKITRTFSLADFAAAMKFVNEVARLAEEEGHHPDIRIAYSKVTLELWTHKINGLFDNDFILAAKIDTLTGNW